MFYINVENVKEFCKFFWVEFNGININFRKFHKICHQKHEFNEEILRE